MYIFIHSGDKINIILTISLSWSSQHNDRNRPEKYLSSDTRIDMITTGWLLKWSRVYHWSVARQLVEILITELL